MITVKREIKYFIVFVMFVVAFIIALNKSQFAQSFTTSDPNYDFRNFENIYERKMNYTKIRMTFKVTDKQKVTQSLTDIFSKYEMNILNREDQGGYSVSIVEFPDEIYADVMRELRQIEGLEEEKVETPPQDSYMINIEENLENKKLLKETIQKELSSKFSLNPERVRDYNSMLNRVQAQIDSLKSKKELMKQNKEKNLLFLKVIKQSSNEINLSSILSRFWSLIKYMVILLLIFSIILIILFLFMDLTMKMLRIIGVKTSHGSSSSYNYNSGYGRKVKRVYKDKHDSNRKHSKEE
ncbi:MAG: hypothetical protein PWQ09_318 [Candidatus Cloacimonadota bacterium]|jgi:hypothetical protein|nr:hypothetical protein [Candidatus Cloacimonadota bacterium]